MLELEHFKRLYLTCCGESEKGLLTGRLGQTLDRSQSRSAQDGGLLVTNSSPTELASKVVAQDDTDEKNVECGERG